MCTDHLCTCAPHHDSSPYEKLGNGFPFNSNHLCVVQRHQYSRNVVPYTLAIYTHPRTQPPERGSPVPRTAGANRREKGRAGESPTATRPQRGNSRTNGSSGRESLDVVRWDRRFETGSTCLSLQALTRKAIAAVVGNWHNVLRAINMASGSSFKTSAQCLPL